MIKNPQNGVFVPGYVFARYRDFVNEKEFLALLHLGALPYAGKKAWQQAAKEMGYKQYTAYANLLEGMATRGVINIDRYNVDATPLWENCADDNTKPSEIEPKTNTVNETLHKSHALLAENFTTLTNGQQPIVSKLGKVLRTHDDIDMIEKVLQMAGTFLAGNNLPNKQIMLLLGNLLDFGPERVYTACQIYADFEGDGYGPIGWVGLILNLLYYKDYDKSQVGGALKLFKIYNKNFRGKREVVEAFCEIQKNLNLLEVETYINYCINATQSTKGLTYQISPGALISSLPKWVANDKPTTFGGTKTTYDPFD